MSLLSHKEHMREATHQPLWLILTGILAFLLASLWATPLQ